ncbi:MAG: hypothetical protein CVU56_20325 [Deltaproteobacteria bacterium HGW-Deltaproteobacteria-14]|nr:MAG: hypothetical protein CVU56_20325 [Deltaproteobacteria bacterium HGW-Deltaproteobacteria-14]
MTLATGAALGSPEAVTTPDGVVVAWTDGLHAHAARLGGDGQVAARATWWGGNERPSRLDPAPEGPAERSAALPARPWISAIASGVPEDGRGPLTGGVPVVVRWQANWWFSDDEGGHANLAHQVTWGEDTGEGQEIAPPGGAWTWLVDLDAHSPLSLVQEHNPNGGPWILRLLGVGAAPIELTSGPAGPYAVDLTSVPGPAAAFHDPATSAFRVVRVAPSGERTEVTVPTLAPFGEAEVALAGAAGRGDLAMAYTTVADGWLTVRLTVLAADASGDRAGPRLTRPEARAVPLKSRFSASQMDAVYVDGRTLITWQDHWDWRIRAVWLKDGQAEGPINELSAGSPRSEGGAAVALPDGGALVAFHRCSDTSICGDTALRTVRLIPGRKPTPVDLGGRAGDRHPRLCVRPDGPVLAVQRGDYGSVSVIWGPPGARHTVDVPTPNHNNGGFAQGLSCEPGGIFLAMSSFGATHDTTRVDVVAVTAAGATTRETLQVPGSLWSLHGLVDDEGRVGLLTNLTAPTGGDVGLRWYPTAASPPTVDVLWRGRTMSSQSVARAGSGPDRRFAAAWYDRGSDGVYAVLAAPDGRRLAGPVRLDDPAARESQNAPVIVREGDTWRAYWEERDQLWRAIPF